MGIFIGLVFFVAIITLIVLLSSNRIGSGVQKKNYGCSPNYKDLSTSQIFYDSSSNILKIVGGFYRPFKAKTFIRSLSIGDKVYFIEEPDNPYDSNAVAVIGINGLHIGYVPRFMTKHVKSELKKGNTEGTITQESDSRYEYFVELGNCENIDDYEEAVSLYRKNKLIEEKSKTIFEKRTSLHFYEKVDSAVALIEKKEYDKVYDLIKPFFDKGIQDGTCYKCIIYYLHYLQKYKEELDYIDRYMASREFMDTDRQFFNRRKFHILRVIGDIQDNSQIENERAGVETTILELDFFHRIVTLLSDRIDPNDIDYKDFKGLFTVYFENLRQPICKLYLNNPDKMFIGLIKEDKSVLKVSILGIDELNDLKEEFIGTINGYKL